MYNFRVNKMLLGKIVGDEDTYNIGESSIFIALEGDINTNTRSAMIRIDSELVDLEDGIYDLHLKLDVTENNENKIKFMVVKGAIKKNIEVGGKNIPVFIKISNDDEFITMKDVQESSNEKIVQETLNKKGNNMKSTTIEMAIKDTPNLKIFDSEENVIYTCNYLDKISINVENKRTFISFKSEIFAPQFSQLKNMKEVDESVVTKIGTRENDKYFKMIGDIILRDETLVDTPGKIIVRDFKFVNDKEIINLKSNEVSEFKTTIECFDVNGDGFVEIELV